VAAFGGSTECHAVLRPSSPVPADRVHAEKTQIGLVACAVICRQDLANVETINAGARFDLFRYAELSHLPARHERSTQYVEGGEIIHGRGGP